MAAAQPKVLFLDTANAVVGQDTTKKADEKKDESFQARTIAAMAEKLAEKYGETVLFDG